jgi:hypothetical protein
MRRLAGASRWPSPGQPAAFEKGGAAAKHDGLFANWNRYRRRDVALEETSSAGVCA